MDIRDLSIPIEAYYISSRLPQQPIEAFALGAAGKERESALPVRRKTIKIGNLAIVPACIVEFVLLLVGPVSGQCDWVGLITLAI